MPRSRAHRRSAHAIIDPLYDAEAVRPTPSLGRSWWYGRGELEAYRLSLLRVTTCTAANVFHPGLFHRHQHLSRFRCSWSSPKALRLTLRFCGSCTLRGRGLRQRWLPARDGQVQRLSLRLPAGDGDLHLDLAGIAEPQAVACDGLPDNTRWDWSEDGFRWAPAVAQTARGQGPSHREGPPRIRLRPQRRDGLSDFGRILLGRVEITADGPEMPRLSVGESRSEALAGADSVREQRCDLVPLGGRRWASETDLALRYGRCDGGRITGVDVAFHPVRWRGAFACSDARLDHIWMRSAYTLRLCLHDFMLDGVKRDRLPWVGDAALALLGNAYAFAEPDILRRTLLVLGGERVGECLPNAIIDYAPWWLIALDLHARHFGDDGWCAAEWPRAQRLLAALESRCDARGLLLHRRDDWLFIDWVPYERQGANAALQMLWAWSLDAAAAIADRAGDAAAALRLRARLRALRRVLAAAWDAQRGGWPESLDVPASPLSRHAAALAVPAGMAGGRRSALRRLLAGSIAAPVGTPYMAAWAAGARAELGDHAGCLDDLRRTWGGMLDADATTFWEAWDPAQSGDAALAFYGRPFGKSLCHAWSGGPAAVLPRHLLGIAPLEDGWKTVSIRPRMAGLSWIAACVPTPLGDITVELENGLGEVRLPEGMVALSNDARRRGRFPIQAR